jgi:hypothetical protein
MSVPHFPNQLDFCRAAFASLNTVGTSQPKDAKSSSAKPTPRSQTTDNVFVTKNFTLMVRSVRKLWPVLPDPLGIHQNFFAYAQPLESI